MCLCVCVCVCAMTCTAWCDVSWFVNQCSRLDTANHYRYSSVETNSCAWTTKWVTGSVTRTEGWANWLHLFSLYLRWRFSFISFPLYMHLSRSLSFSLRFFPSTKVTDSFLAAIDLWASIHSIIIDIFSEFFFRKKISSNFLIYMRAELP